MGLNVVDIPRSDGWGGSESSHGLQKDRAVENGVARRGEENHVAYHSDDPRYENTITTLAPAVREDGNAHRADESGGIWWDRHELCLNRTISHVVDDSWGKVGQAKQHIANEEESGRHNENLVE